MSVPSAAALLQAWDAAQGRPSWERASIVLGAAHPDLPPERLAALGVGARNRALLALRMALFGPTLAGDVTCPACATRAETSFPAVALAAAGSESAAGELHVAVDDWQVRLRPPSAGDLAAAAATGDVERARGLLLERCVVAASKAGGAAPGAPLPESVTGAVLQRLAADDPVGDVELAVRCPACAHQWTVDLDVEAYLWEELGAWAVRLLHEVHRLASAYGWAEADILALGAWRRRVYLEMAG